jgi:hypothetical protein
MPLTSEIFNRIQDNIWDAFEQARKCRAWASSVATAITNTSTVISQAAAGGGGGVTPYVPPPPTPGANLLWENELLVPVLPSSEWVSTTPLALTTNREDRAPTLQGQCGDYWFAPGSDGDTVKLAIYWGASVADSGVWQWNFQTLVNGVAVPGGDILLSTATGNLTSHVTSVSMAVTNGSRIKVIMTGSQQSGTSTSVQLFATVVVSIMGPSGVGGGTTIALTGDVTGSGTSSIPTTLATVATAGSFTNANITIDAKGRVLAAANGASGTGVSNIDFLLESDPPTPGTTDSITYSSGLVTNETWVNTSNSHTVKVISYTYSSGLVATESRKVYDSAGTTIVGQVDITYVYSGSTLTGSTIVRTI